ncbi:PREDICTED: lysM domain receptor-like kinase 4 [Ipomoea nil]|uniref:lysM domain receptor-like kinase 4 n=1 Tax=Ipomoea nil TaxID=35883 RepID=UPI000901B2A2|nr:PREDICTED: lysM domain receptor-like kinase 4 [Ipomoea nil]
MMFGWLLVWMFSVYSSYAQQYYDSTLCSDTSVYPGTRYTCNSSRGFSCPTFLVYRASHDVRTISTISSLFNIPPAELLSPRNNVTSGSEILEPGREVLIPVQCSCSGGFFSANFSYTPLENTTFGSIACEVFEGLVKPVTLAEENPSKVSWDKDSLGSGTKVVVPLKCACPYKSWGLKYLVTYPIVSGDDADLLSKKFRIPIKEIWDINSLSFKDTIYPNTTILLPLKSEPSINFSVSNSEPPSPGFLQTSPVEKPGRNLRLKKLYISGSVIGFCLLVATLVSCSLYLRTLRKFRAARAQSSIRRTTSFSTPRSSPKSGPMARSSTNSCLSPDLLAGLKYSLCNYTAEELKNATRGFDEDAKVSESVYRGWVDNSQVLIKQMRFEGTRQIIDVHSRINHVNIVRLQGVCYGENDFSSCFLVFEFPANGSLRECLSNPPASLRWHGRTQIAFDIATGLHYLHFCTIPPYTHMNVNTKNIFLTQNWRAKLTVFAAVPSPSSGGSMGSLGGWVLPEHLVYGSEELDKGDIFAFGVVLLELLSGKDDGDGRLVRDSIMFVGGGGGSEGGCFEQLRNFMDPNLKEDYPLAEALCLAVLAKACIEDDPRHRPSMDDIIKILARMV